MAKVKISSASTPPKKIRPALTPESRENQMISLATDLAEKQLLDGTASSAVITHYLKLGTVQAKLEMKRIEQEIELQKAKTKALGNADELKELTAAALKAMRRYTGNGVEDESYEDEY